MKEKAGGDRDAEDPREDGSLGPWFDAEVMQGERADEGNGNPEDEEEGEEYSGYFLEKRQMVAMPAKMKARLG